MFQNHAHLRDFVLGLVGVMLAALLVPTSPAAASPSYDVVVSSAWDRSSAVPLDGQTVSGDVFVFTASDVGVSRVRFWVDDPSMSGAPTRTENFAPFDLGPGRVDTSAWADGPHLVTALLETTDGPVVVTASFTVDNNPEPGSAVVSLTFDDAAGSQYLVRPALAEHGLKGTFYVPSGWVGVDAQLTWDQLADFSADGHEIGGHTVTHRNLTTLPLDEARRQICNDRAALAERGFPRPPSPTRSEPSTTPSSSS